MRKTCLAMWASAWLLVSACASNSTATPEPQSAQATQSELAQGQALVETHCARCHATGVEDDSPFPEAPAFRTLSRNYRVSMLAEALAEGISVGHPAMPEFAFAVDDVDAIIAYLNAIQEPGPTPDLPPEDADASEAG